MRQKSVFAVAALAIAFIFVQATQPKVHAQFLNGAQGNNKSWLVRNHQGDPHPTQNYIALRLKVTAITGDGNVTATLTRYDTITGTGSGRTYVKKTGEGGQITVRGKVVEQSEGGTTRKKDRFELTGIYFDEQNQPHLVIAQGYYHTGKRKNTGSGDRTDDRVCLRIRDKAVRDLRQASIAERAMAAAGAPRDEPCDEQPPDEDVLNEDDTPDDTDPSYDP